MGEPYDLPCLPAPERRLGGRPPGVLAPGVVDEARQSGAKPGRLTPVVDALRALRGLPCTVAVTTGAEIGALTRFETPRELMTF